MSLSAARTHHTRLASSTRLASQVVALFVLVATALLLATSPAHAAAYRYWSYWQGEGGTWVAAQTGPGDHTITDGDVQGWRFGITTVDASLSPDNAPDFATLCPVLAAEAAPAGQVRAAVVIDSGSLADAPEGQVPPADTISCVTVPEGSTGNQALAAAGTVTNDTAGIVCSINAYPAGECGAEVSDEAAASAAVAAAAESPNPAVPGGAADASNAEGTGVSAPPWAGLGLIVVAGGALGVLVTSRRRRSQ